MQRRFLRKRGAAGSVLALSVTAYAVPPLPKGEALAWRQSYRLNCEVYGFARDSPFEERLPPLRGKMSPQVTKGGIWRVSALEGEDANRSAALSQKAALQMPFSVTTPPVKMGFRKVRRLS